MMMVVVVMVRLVNVTLMLCVAASDDWIRGKGAGASLAEVLMVLR